MSSKYSRKRRDDLARHCRQMLMENKTKEEVLSYLKEIGCSLSSSCVIWAKANNLSFDKAQIQVLGSKTWENERSDAIDCHNQFMDMLDKL
ncbi:hypothetical protein [Roseofilum sp. Belize Diploria]|uniref:hypothetical protein n=1 Tax=Roseofilum sp. Belize Diploria TaxID=2821501 RepID=UPI001B1D22D1|nr:hypothetical protein [Roseofilum sp. Belize Diploria]MBP0008524.1 hypothetical protein [Roseofilum sp. Belize Diploria]